MSTEIFVMIGFYWMFARTFRMVPRTLVNVYRNIRDDRSLLNVGKNLQNGT